MCRGISVASMTFLPDSPNILTYGVKLIPGHHMAQNNILCWNIVSVVRITLALIMSYHWYGIIGVINAKYLSSDSFLIWNNAKIYCCSHFKCHIYKYLLNIRTMLEGWERFWWSWLVNVHFALWWSRDSNTLSWLASYLCLQ